MAAKIRRIYELAKHYKISSNAMVTLLKDLGLAPKSHMSVATPEMIAAVNMKIAREREAAKKEMAEKQKAKAARQRSARPSRPSTGADRRPSSVSQGTSSQGSYSRPATSAGSTTTSSGPPPVQQRGGTGVGTGQRRGPGGGPGGGPGRRGPIFGGGRRRGKPKRKKRDRTQVDQGEVAKSFRATMADLSGVKTKRKFSKSDGSGDGSDGQPTNILEVNEFMSVAELASAMGRKSAEVVVRLLELGMMATINQRLDMDTIETVAAEFDFEAKPVAEIGETAKEEEKEEGQVPRAPVVTVMGHVDHGKTSLLDYVRKTNVVAGEAGSITQHIGAYEVMHGENRIVFLDTPGHEAFTAMRARGTQITDIVVIIVAADEGVMPQTVEAIDHARAASVPIIIALSKIDKPGARSDEIRTQLANKNILSEDWGGKTIMVEISSKTGEGIEKLLDMIVLQAELMELKADPTIRAQGVVVDARLERGRGPVVTVLVKKGTCKIGDPVVAGIHSGRIRTMLNDREQKLQIAGPIMPIQVTGISGVPQAGDSFMAVRDDQEAKDISAKRAILKREHEHRRPTGAVTLDRVFDQIKEGQIKEVRLIIKADVDGSVEVLSDSLGKLGTSEVKTNIIHRAVGAVTESDVLLASASNAIIISFQITQDARARDLAKSEKVDIRNYSVIYEAESDVRKALEGLLSPTITEKFVGLAEVRDTFKVPKIGMVAGTYVKEGRISRGDKVKLTRDGKQIYTGNISSLRRFKDDAREVKEGFECGIGIENFNDIKVGDLIEAFELVETARTLA